MKLVSAKCPNCGAQIDVDKNSDSTVCEYCNSKIIVEDAIAKYKVEISGSVQVNNLPTIENYIKLGNRHYSDGEYYEAFNMYKKAIELDPDNYEAVIRNGFSKSLCSNYESFQVSPAINGLKHAYDILKRDNQNIIDAYISECNIIIKNLDAILVSIYQSRALQKDEVMPFNEKIQDCLNAFEYLYSIVGNDKNLKISILENIIQEINNLKLDKSYVCGYNAQGMTLKRPYRLNNNIKNELIAKQRKYNDELVVLKNGIESSNVKIKQNTKVAPKGFLETLDRSLGKTKDAIYRWDIVRALEGKKPVQVFLEIICYLLSIAYAFWAIIEGITDTAGKAILCLIAAIVFFPWLKKLIVKKCEKKLSNVIILIWIARLVLMVIVFWSTILNTESTPYTYEGVWKSESGMVVELKRDKTANIKLSNGNKLIGKYTTESIDDGYTIKVTIDNSQEVKELTFKYVKKDNNIKFYLDNEGQPSTFFTPENPKSEYKYLTECRIIKGVD